MKMGLLALFSKKSSSDLTERHSLKACAYDATVALEPPIRGTYPVPGNGSKILAQFQQSHPNLAGVSRGGSPAPSPRAPRLRSNGAHESGLERPRTAPSSQLGGLMDRPSFQSRPTSEMPSPPKKKYGPFKLPPKNSTDTRVSSASTYSDSVRSGKSSNPKGYVDLLDAQSRIKPLDFYGRIEATGAKIYGEDVADRNRQEESIDAQKSKAQESLSDHDNAIRTPVISKDIDDDTDDEPPMRSRIRHSVSSGLRSKYASTRAPGAFPKRTSSRHPPHNAEGITNVMSRTTSARSERAARRKSMPSFSANTSHYTQRSSLVVRRAADEDVEDFPDSLRDRAKEAASHEWEHTKPNISSERQSMASPHVEYRTRLQRSDLEKPLPALPPPSKDLSKRRSITHRNSSAESRLLVKRRSFQNIQSTSRGEIYEDTYQQKISLQNAQPPRIRISTRRQLGSTTDLQDIFYESSAQQSDHKSQITSSPSKRVNNGAGSVRPKHLRKQSMISLSNASIAAHEAENTIPERASSLRHWSITSETALSTLSSNPFRPQSGHTTSTSVDFSPMSPHAHSNLSIPPVPDIPALKSLHSVPRNRHAMPPSTRPMTSAKHDSGELRLEDYAISNDGSTTPSRGSYEKDLLFSETDYDLSGNQASGLPGLFEATIPVTSPSPDLSTIRAPERDLPSVSGLLYFPAFTGAESDDSVEDFEQPDSSDSEMNFDIPTNRTSSALHRVSAQGRLSAKRQPIHEEEDDSDF